MFPGMDMAKQVCKTMDGMDAFVYDVSTTLGVDKLVNFVVEEIYGLFTL